MDTDFADYKRCLHGIDHTDIAGHERILHEVEHIDTADQISH